MLDPTNPLADAIAAVIVSLAMTAASVVGGVLNAWLARRKQASKDLAAAFEKIRMLAAKVGVEIKCPNTELNSLDDAFDLIRKIEAKVSETKS